MNKQSSKNSLIETRDSGNKALSYNSGANGRQMPIPPASNSFQTQSLRANALLQQPQDKINKVPLVQASIKFGGTSSTNSLIGFTKPQQKVIPPTNPDLRTSASKSPTQRQSFGSNLSYGGGSKLRMSTSGSSNTMNQTTPISLTDPNMGPQLKKREIPKFLQAKPVPPPQTTKPQLITQNIEDDDSVEIEIEFDEKDLHTIEISSTSTTKKGEVVDRRTDEEILGLDQQQVPKAPPSFAWSYHGGSNSDLSSGVQSSNSKSSSVVEFMRGGNTNSNNFQRMPSNDTYDYNSYRPQPPSSSNYMKQKNAELHSFLNESASKGGGMSKPQPNRYAEIIDVDSEPSTAIQYQNRNYNQQNLQKINSQYSNSSQGNYGVNQLFMKRMGKDVSSYNYGGAQHSAKDVPTPPQQQQRIIQPQSSTAQANSLHSKLPTQSPITDTIYYKMMDQQKKSEAPQKQILSSSFKKQPDFKSNAVTSQDDVKRMKDKIQKNIGSTINLQGSTSVNSSSNNDSDSSSDSAQKAYQGRKKLHNREDTPKLWPSLGYAEKASRSKFQLSLTKNGSKHKSYGGGMISDQKRHDEQMKSIKEMIKSKVGHSHTLREEEQRLEKERQKELDRKQAEEELKIKQQKEKEDLYQQLFGGVAAKTEEKKPKKSVKENEDDARLYKEIQEEAEKRRAAEANGEFDRQAAIARIDFEARQREEKERKLRYHRRKDPNELIHRILNLEIIEMFQDKLFQQELSNVPLQFQSFEHYQTIWVPLFLYETYSQMISKRTEGEKDRELMEARGQKINQMAIRKKHFEGFISKGNSDYFYVDLRLYESAKNDPDKFGNYTMSVLDSLKEFDLLLISEQPLPVDEAKKLTGIDYLLKMKKETGKLLSLVSARRKRDSPYITLKVDNKIHADYLTLNVRSNDLLKVHVYFFDSLITSVREFRTINCCEFFPTAQFILDPTKINKHRESQPASLEPHRMAKMQEFIKLNGQSFNASQLEALDNVIKMKKEDFLLIQGPPGTGKTHTIQGIITMLVKAQVKKILICAPSNAAIDEIVMRIATLKLFGVLSDEDLKEKLLRIGSMDYEPLAEVKKYTLDAKLKEEMDVPDHHQAQKNAQPGSNIDLENKIDTIKQRTQSISTMRRILTENNMEKEKGRFNQLLRILFPQADSIIKFNKLSNETMLKELKSIEDSYEKKRVEIKAQLDATTEMKRMKPKSKRSDVEKQIVEKAQIICTTLSMSAIEKLDILGHDTLEYLIVDEACQCVELNCLIPFEHNPQKVILVGDQQQLPATTFSDNSDRTFYSRSLFERFLQTGVNRYMLSIQYRMHPLIRQFPSDQFYEGRLQDAESVVKFTPEKKSFLVREIEKTIQNLVFFDLKYAQEETKETSKSNKDEAFFIEELFSDIIKIMLQSTEMPGEIQRASHSEKMDFICKELKGKIGIITPYKSQVRTLKDHIYPKLRSLKFPIDLLEINTVDAYQGREKEIIIISCVRGSQERTLGFLNDYRRMNVAITRAKHFLWIVGNSRTLKRNENWDQLINFTRQKSQEFMKTAGESPQRAKSTKNSCYIQLNSKDQWMHHKLLDILMGTLPSPKTFKNNHPSSGEEEEDKSPIGSERRPDRSQKMQQQPKPDHHQMLDKMTGKRQLRELLDEPKTTEKPSPERMRDEKYREKFGTSDKKISNTPVSPPKIKPQLTPPKAVEVPQVQPAAPPTSLKSGNKNLDQAFQQLFASFGPPTTKPQQSTPSKPTLDLNKLCKDAVRK